MNPLNMRFLVPKTLRNTDNSKVSKHISKEVEKVFDEGRNKERGQETIEKQKDDIFKEFFQEPDNDFVFESMRDFKIDVQDEKYNSSGRFHPWVVTCTLQTVPYICVEILPDRTYVCYNPDSESKRVQHIRGVDTEVVS